MLPALRRCVLQKHDDMIKDINAKLPEIDQFSARCRENIPNIPFQSDNLHKMISNIANRKEFLIEVWTSRKNLYKQHLDFLKWRSEITTLPCRIELDRKPTSRTFNSPPYPLG